MKINFDAFRSFGHSCLELLSSRSVTRGGITYTVTSRFGLKRFNDVAAKELNDRFQRAVEKTEAEGKRSLK